MLMYKGWAPAPPHYILGGHRDLDGSQARGLNHLIAYAWHVGGWAEAGILGSRPGLQTSPILE